MGILPKILKKMPDEVLCDRSVSTILQQTVRSLNNLRSYKETMNITSCASQYFFL